MEKVISIKSKKESEAITITMKTMKNKLGAKMYMVTKYLEVNPSKKTRKHVLNVRVSRDNWFIYSNREVYINSLIKKFFPQDG
jgi:hypothetical protein